MDPLTEKAVLAFLVLVGAIPGSALTIGLVRLVSAWRDANRGWRHGR
jgi:hypothetical protein